MEADMMNIFFLSMFLGGWGGGYHAGTGTGILLLH